MRSSVSKDLPVAILSLQRMFAKAGTDVNKIARRLIALDRSNPRLLARKLRSHLLEHIDSDGDVEYRNDLDNLLSFYGYLEIGLATQVLRDLKLEVFDTARRVLRIEAVRRYYETFYPVALAGALRLRLDGRPVLAPRSETEVFSELITLHYQLLNEDVEIYLTLLDDFIVDGIDFDTLLESVGKPREFAQRMLDPEQEDDVLASGTRGLVRFLQFSQSFDNLLNRQTDPDLQSAMWHVHSYWYELMGGLIYGALSSLVEQFREWIPSKPSKGVARGDLKRASESLDESLSSLRRLTSATYRHRFESAYSALREQEEMRSSPTKPKRTPSDQAKRRHDATDGLATTIDTRNAVKAVHSPGLAEAMKLIDGTARTAHVSSDHVGKMTAERRVLEAKIDELMEQITQLRELRRTLLAEIEASQEAPPPQITGGL